MRLIDADALKKTIKNMPNDYYGDLCVGDALKEIDNAPTISAVPVVRGEWVEAKSGVMSVWPPGQVMCSVCGQRMPSQWKKMPPYCYGCGAKMESEGST